MYIEREKLLVKKVLWKKLSVSMQLWSDRDTCERISQKELKLWESQNSYEDFSDMLFDTKILIDVLYKNCYIQNMLFFDNDLSEKYNQWLLDFPQRFIYESNKAEGSKIPFEQLQLIFQSKKTYHQNAGEIQEVKNSIDVWKYLQRDFVFNKAGMKKVYHKLTKDLLMSSGDSYPRGFRKVDVVVNNDYTSKAENIRREIDSLLSYYKQNKKKIFPLQLAFDFHLRYEQIHPFRDGNGRTGRMLMNKVLLANNFLPCIVYSSNREAYFSAINSAKEGRKKKYYKFMLEQYLKTLNSLW